MQAKSLVILLDSITAWTLVAHRGASGVFPEHTVRAYEEGAKYADLIECDLALTKDFRLICTHDNWLNKTTNAYKIFGPEKMETKIWAGSRRTDYFTQDFTLDELKQLRGR